MNFISNKLLLISKLLVSNTNKPIFDKDNGLGSTPMQKSIDYYGFIKYMKTSQFRKLVPIGRTSQGERFQQLKNKIYNGYPIAPPFLNVQWNDKLKCWQCYGHEGRSRIDVIKQIYGDIIVPVHIFPYKMRHNDLTEQMKNAIILKQTM